MRKKYLYTIFFIIYTLVLETNIAIALKAEEKLLEAESEQKARQIYKQIRCLVCDKQSIDD